MKSRNNKNGFTLIELLLVIALIAIIASFAIMTYRAKAETARIDKAAISIQNILQAALAYNVAQNGSWPPNNMNANCIPPTDKDTQNFINNYLPNQDHSDPYGTNYCWQTQGDTKRLFAVIVQAPDNNQKIARRIAGQLPNAVTLSTPTGNPTDNPCASGTACYIKTEVPQPGSSSNVESGVTIVAVGTCRPGDKGASGCVDDVNHQAPASAHTEYTIYFPSCPADKTPRLTVTANLFQTMSTPGGLGFPLEYLGAVAANCTNETSSNPKQGYCTASVIANVMTVDKAGNGKVVDVIHPPEGASAGSVGATYIVTCDPKSTSLKNNFFNTVSEEG